jgi:DNA adenine methylase
MNYIKSPLNYIGGKFKLLPQILPLLPKSINTFVDLFAGGCNVGINIKANKIIFNDNLSFLIELYNAFKMYDLQYVLNHIETQIKSFGLSPTNEDAYKLFRTHYNLYKNPLDLFILICYSFNHQIRFNNSHEYNNAFGKIKGDFNISIEKNLINFINKIKENNFEFICANFEAFDISILVENDFVYCDPPYLITLGTYNDGKRGFTTWDKNQEIKLLNLLDNLNTNNIKFALSNVLKHGDKTNNLLIEFINDNKYIKKIDILADYKNSNYQKKIKTESEEVLILNYVPETSKIIDIF